MENVENGTVSELNTDNTVSEYNTVTSTVQRRNFQCNTISSSVTSAAPEFETKTLLIKIKIIILQEDSNVQPGNLIKCKSNQRFKKKGKYYKLISFFKTNSSLKFVFFR